MLKWPRAGVHHENQGRGRPEVPNKKAPVSADASKEVIHLPRNKGKFSKIWVQFQRRALKPLAFWIALLTIVKLLVELAKLLVN